MLCVSTFNMKTLTVFLHSVCFPMQYCLLFAIVKKAGYQLRPCWTQIPILGTVIAFRVLNLWQAVHGFLTKILKQVVEVY